MSIDTGNRAEAIPVMESPAGLFSRFRSAAREYMLLTKPRIVMLFGLTGLAAMVMEGSLTPNHLTFWMIFLGMVLTAGSANALNQYIDRDIDAVMERTRVKRPLPSGRLSPESALVFALCIGTLAIFLLQYFGNWIAAAWGVFTIAFYVGIYTMWLKRRTPYNIVIGGAAGATAPLIGWAAASATGEVSWAAWIMFAIIFMWTPPHFWALALCVKDEYANASVPMLPVVKGEAATRSQIWWYTVALVPLTLSLFFINAASWLYLGAAVLLGYFFVKQAWVVYSKSSKLEKPMAEKQAWRLFGYSIVYLLALFMVLLLDSILLPKAHAGQRWMKLGEGVEARSPESRGRSEIPAPLKNIGITENLGAQVDLNLTFRNEQGQVVPLRSVVDGRKPTLLFLAYYQCPNLCNFFLVGALEGLKKLAMSPAKDFNIVTISINPTEEPSLAAAKKENFLKELNRPGAEQGWHFWVNDVAAKVDSESTHVKTLANQVGFGYKYDKDQEQFAHAAGMIALTPEGRVARYLHGIEFQPQDLRLALVEAGGRKIGSVVDHIKLFCYSYDPHTKKYALYATNLMKAGAALMIFALGAVFLKKVI